MLKSIKREFLLNRNSLWQSLAVLGGAWLLGEALSLCIMYFAHEEEYFSLGTVFAAIMLVMFGVIFALYYFSCGYEQALTMSCTRRRFLFGMFVTVCLQLLCLVGGIVVLTLLDLFGVREHLVTREISIGDYVLTGGELAACIIADSVIRIIPGAIGDEASALTDCFQDNLLAPPVYTRPAEFNGWKVPDVLLSGNFARIDRWKEEQAWERTKRLRPDLLKEE